MVGAPGFEPGTSSVSVRLGGPAEIGTRRPSKSQAVTRNYMISRETPGPVSPGVPPRPNEHTTNTAHLGCIEWLQPRSCSMRTWPPPLPPPPPAPVGSGSWSVLLLVHCGNTCKQISDGEVQLLLSLSTKSGLGRDPRTVASSSRSSQSSREVSSRNSASAVSAAAAGSVAALPPIQP